MYNVVWLRDIDASDGGTETGDTTGVGGKVELGIAFCEGAGKH